MKSNQSETTGVRSIEMATQGAKSALRGLIIELVDHRDSVSLATIPGKQTVIFEVTVHDEDVRRLIGRKGRTADAIRELLVNMGSKAKQRFILEIVDPLRRLEEVPALPGPLKG